MVPMVLAWGVWAAYLVLAWLLFEEANQQNPGRNDGSRTLLYTCVLSIVYGICLLFLKASLLLRTIELFAQLQDFFYWSCHCDFGDLLLLYGHYKSEAICLQAYLGRLY
ncbi:hypothetical protein BJX65DRAFT_305439 [Aspergillus insuetus]